MLNTFNKMYSKILTVLKIKIICCDKKKAVVNDFILFYLHYYQLYKFYQIYYYITDINICIFLRFNMTIMMQYFNTFYYTS